MKKLFVGIGAALLLLTCAGCAAAPETSAVSGEPVIEKAWRFEVETETYMDEYKTADGTLLCAGSYEYPTLLLLDDGGNPYSGAGAPPTEEQLAVCKAFNERFREEEFAASFGSLRQIAISGREEIVGSGFPYSEEQVLTSVYRTDGLVSIEYGFYTYTGGAHGYGGRETVNFDLKLGRFIDWPELASDAEALRERLGGEVAAAIQRDGMDSELFDDYENNARALAHAVCSFNEQGVSITFPESVLGSHAAGEPQFSVAYERFEDLLSERGARLLGLEKD